MSVSAKLSTPSRDPESREPHPVTAATAQGYEESLHAVLGVSPGDPSVVARRLVKRQSLSHAANAPARAVALGRTQQTHGNRLAQRLIASGTSGSALRPPVIQRKCACGGTCDSCQDSAGGPADVELASPNDLDALHVQRQPAAAAPSGGDLVEDDVVPSGSQGEPLDPHTLELMKSRMAHDFTGVRVHTDHEAATSARALHAIAYTVGRDIYFAAGQYAPQTASGQQLVAHELTHTIQQGQGLVPPAVATQSRGPLVVGRPDDPLEHEAEAVAEEVAQTTPASIGVTAASARLQRRAASARGGGAAIQRQDAGGAKPEAEAPRQGPVPLRPRPGAEEAWFQGVHLADDRAWVRAELRNLIARSGLKGADLWLDVLMGRRGTVDLPFSAHARGYGGLRVRSPLDVQREMPQEQVTETLRRLKPMVGEVYAEVRAEAVTFTQEFETAAKKSAHMVLDANETQVKAEAMRYGITAETIEKVRYEGTGEGPRIKTTVFETQYHMGTDSPSARGLQGAAQVLLDRRRHIESLQEKQRKQVKWEKDPLDPKGRILVPDEHHAATGLEIEKGKRSYEQMRSHLSAEYPALAAFSSIDKGTDALETIARKGPDPATAALIGGKIADILTNIKKARKGIDDGDVNVWRLPKIVDLTAIQFGATTDNMKRRLVADKREAEQPGFWQDLALLVMNIAAIVLAAPTGGASLAVAAGVNVAVAAVHVEEYLMKEALSGTAFDKAQALSQEDPSLFWLAVEIVGVAADIGGAVGALSKTFKNLAPAVKAAQAASEGEQAAKALDVVRATAKAEGGAAFAERVVARIKDARSGSRTAVLKAAGATEEEIKILQKAGLAAEAEAAAGIGKAVKSAIGEVNISKSGHIWSCASPCAILREKYASVFAKSDEASKALHNELKLLEAEAETAAQARKAATAKNNAEALAKAEEMANTVKTKAAALEERILKANPNLIQEGGLVVELTDKQAQRLQRVSDALKDESKWGNVSAYDRFRLGRVYDKLMESLVGAAIKRTGGKVLHYVEVDAKLIADLRAKGGRVLITEGKIGGMRFDLMEIDFAKGTAELIDVAATSSASHVAKTSSYKTAAQKLLNMPVDAKEMLYTGPKGELLETLLIVPVK